MKLSVLVGILAAGICSASSVQALAIVESPFCSLQDSHQSFFGATAASANCAAARLSPSTSFTASAFAYAHLQTELTYGASAMLRLDSGFSGDSANVMAAGSSHDRVTLTVGSQLLLGFLIDGAFSSKPVPQGVSVAGGATLQVSCNGTFSQQDVTNGGFYIHQCPYVVNQPFDLVSQLDVRTTLTAGATLPFDALVNADYSHTARLVSVIVLDAAGKPVLNPTMVSESGFDYLAASAAPEPGSLSLLFAGGLLIAGARFRKRGHARKGQVG